MADKFKVGDIAVSKGGDVVRIIEVLPNQYGRMRVAVMNVEGDEVRLNDYNLLSMREIMIAARALRAEAKR